MKTWCGLTCFLIAVSSAPAVFAQDAGIKVGDTQFVPSVELGFYSSDNAFRENDDEVDETGVSVSPKVIWEASKGRIAVSAQYAGELYSSSEDSLDRDWHTLRLSGAAEATSRHRFTSSLSVRDLTEGLEEGFSRSIPPRSLDNLIRFRDLNARLDYTFGARGARGNVQVGLSASSRRFLNFSDITMGGDFSVIRPSLGFSYRLGGDSRAFVIVRHSTVDFDSASSDRTELSALGGVRWNENRKLSGEILLGGTLADFDNQNDQSVFVAEAGLVYRATSFSRVNLDLRRELATDDGRASISANDATIRNTVGLEWLFSWNSRVSSTASVGYTNNDRDCPDNDNNILALGFGAEYQFRRWLAFGVGVDRDSNSVDSCEGVDDDIGLIEDTEYDRVRGSVFLRASL